MGKDYFKRYLKPYIKLPLIYFIISFVWIVSSDYLLFFIKIPLKYTQLVAMLKGTIFISGTTLLLYFLIKKDFFTINSNNEKLNKALNQYIDLFNKFPNPIFRTNNNGECDYFNESWCSFTGRTLDEELEKGWTNSIHPDEKEHVLEKFHQAILIRDNSLIRSRLKSKDGSYHWMLIHGSPFYDLEKEFAGYIYSCYDINTEILNEEKIMQQLEEINQIYKYTPVGLFVVDKGLAYLKINEMMADITGYPVEFHYGKRIEEIIPDMADLLKEICKPVLEEGKTVLDIKISGKTHKNPEIEKDWIANYFPLKSSVGEVIGVIGAVLDVTQQSKAEKEIKELNDQLEKKVDERTNELAKVNKQLEVELEKEKAIEETVKLALIKEKELNELKSKFISTISHEFRTPLATVLSSIELLEMFGQKWNIEKISNHISRIKESIKYLTNLLDEVISMNRIETGKLKINLEEKDLYELCRILVEEAKDLSCGRHKIEYKFESESKIFLIDEKLLRYILNNLLSNAVKYSPEGGNISLSVTPGKNDIRFELQDEGLGIPQDDQAHLFEPFFRAANTQNINGSGLGLSIVKNSIELSNGQIFFDSKENDGTRFIFILPLINPPHID